MKSAKRRISVLALLTASLLGGTACSGAGNEALQTANGGASGGTSPTDSGSMIGVGGHSPVTGGASNSGLYTGGSLSAAGSSSSSSGTVGNGGGSEGGATAASGGSIATGGTVATGGKAVGGTQSGGTVATGGKAVGGTQSGGTVATGGKAVGGTQSGGTVASGGKAAGGTQAGGTVATGGKAAGGAAGASTYPIATGTPKVYLAGDSTCQTYAASQAPQQGWGQRFQEFFTSTSDVLIVNKAMGGRSSLSFITEGRLDEILAVIKPGDYLFAQWGINDRAVAGEGRATDPATTFRTYLKQYIDGARSKNAIPVLLTPTPRHQYVNGVFQNGFAAYCDAIKAVAAETNTLLIDVQSKGLAYYTSIGDAAVMSTIILNGTDPLHFSTEGAYQMARLVAEGVVELKIPISQFVVQSKL